MCKYFLSSVAFTNYKKLWFMKNKNFDTLKNMELDFLLKC